VLVPSLLVALLPLSAAALPAPQYPEMRSVARATPPAAKPMSKRAGVERLVADLKAALARTRRNGSWGVLVVSLSHGDTLFGRNPDRQFLPASTMKLFTSAVALDRFGPEGRFETAVLRAGALGTDGVLRGDLVLRGAGDPTLSGRPADGAAEPPMATLARLVAGAGITRVTGAIIGDASAFDDAAVPDGWKAQYLRSPYAARVSALSFNENRIRVAVRPAGLRAAVTIEPSMSGVAVSNEVRVARGSRAARVAVHEDSAGRLRLTGWIGALSRTRVSDVVVEHPELFAAGALRAALAELGVLVDGPARAGQAPADAVPVAALESPPLGRIIAQMNGESNNHFAELLFRDAARDVGVAGSAENANVLLRRFLYEKANVPPTMVFAADGSGLSILDRVTPRAMVHLLDYVRRAPWGPVLEQSLPVAGETETLRNRMRGTPASGNLRGKTGTTSAVASLGGYVTARNGEQLAFAFIYNGGYRLRARNVIDAMGAALARFTR